MENFSFLDLGALGILGGVVVMLTRCITTSLKDLMILNNNVLMEMKEMRSDINKIENNISNLKKVS